MKKVDFLAKLEVKQPRLFNFYNYDELPSEFNSHDKISIKCPDHGIFEQKAYSHGNGQGCLECYRVSRSTGLDEFLQKARAIHGERYNYDKVKYLNSYTKIIITCKEHGDFEQTPDSHLKGYNCATCSSVKFDLKTFIEKANLVHGHFYDYSQTVYVNSKVKVAIVCPNHGRFEQVAMSHLLGIGCHRCSVEKRTGTLECFLKRAVEVHGVKYDYSQTVYVNASTKLNIGCPKHGVFEQLPLNHLAGRGCLSCNESNGEKEISRILTENGITFSREYKIPDSSYRYDFYLPDQNILIEFHGIQHYKAIEFFGGEEMLLDQKRRDEDKTKLAKTADIDLIVLGYRHLDSGYLEANLITELTRIYRYWFSTPEGILTFKGTRELCEFLGMKHIPLPTLIFKVIAEKYPSYKMLF